MQRQKSAKEFGFWLVTKAYVVVFPFLLIVGSGCLYALTSNRPEAKIAGLPLFTLMVWTTILAPVALFMYGTFSRRRLLKSIVTSLRNPDVFCPSPTFEVYHEGEGKYLGIDVEHGTILYVHKIRKGAVDVVALTMDDWTNREVDENTLRLYTKRPQLPRIEISTPWAQRWFDVLGAMEHQRPTPRRPFPSHVGNALEGLERQHHIQIPRFA
ncbi:plasmid IncI1-type surface exclusion protein ExcA [Pseudomonas mosselii]|uniref:plasmid IncI1-type surface exclusion protein ExcA n=1 Tax=Pseudomonas mosselii TaxID=78327 RepID=UPI00286FEA58|nr:plasmid IncI1-type surface exclusion protein ExcA [Pseudomonas mosselii]